jgi:hypothetical protein
MPSRLARLRDLTDRKVTLRQRKPASWRVGFNTDHCLKCCYRFSILSCRLEVTTVVEQEFVIPRCYFQSLRLHIDSRLKIFVVG